MEPVTVEFPVGYESQKRAIIVGVFFVHVFIYYYY